MVNSSYKNIFIAILLLFIIKPLAGQIRISPWVGFGSQSIKYSSSEATVDGVYGINLGVDAYYYLNENMAIGAGVRMGSYESSAKYDAFSLDQSLVDQDGDSYVLTTTSNGIEESHKLSTIEIPILFRYERWVTTNLMLFGATGPVFVLPGTLKSEFVSGDLSTSGFYPEWKLTIDDVDEYGFLNRSLSGEMSAPEAKTTFSWAIEAGGEVFLAKRIHLMVTLYYQPGLSNITDAAEGGVMPDPFTFNGSLMGANDAKLSKMGIRLGLNIDLTPKEKASIKSIR